MTLSLPLAHTPTHLFAEGVNGEADHVEVAAADATHKGRGGTLNAVGARLAIRLTWVLLGRVGGLFVCLLYEGDGDGRSACEDAINGM